MKKLYYLSLFVIVFIACNKDCEKYYETRYVNNSNLTSVIPYSDTTVIKFLKNGRDTITYSSQGLKETFTESYESNTRSGGCGTNLKLQQYSLKMVHTDIEFFEIIFYRNYSSSNYINVNINGNAFNKLSAPEYTATNSDLTGEYFDNYVVNNTNYTNVSKISIDSKNYFIAKPKSGILTMFINNDLYELIP